MKLTPSKYIIVLSVPVNVGKDNNFDAMAFVFCYKWSCAKLIYYLNGITEYS